MYLVLLLLIDLLLTLDVLLLLLLYISQILSVFIIKIPFSSSHSLSESLLLLRLVSYSLVCLRLARAWIRSYGCIYVRTYTQTDQPTDRQTDRHRYVKARRPERGNEVGRAADAQTDRLTDKQSDPASYAASVRKLCTNKQTNIHAVTALVWKYNEKEDYYFKEMA